MKKILTYISMFFGVLILALGLGSAPLFATSTISEDITVSDGTTTFSTFYDVTYDDAVYTTDGVNIAKTVDGESEILFSATGNPIVSIGVIDEKLLFTQSDDFVFLYDPFETIEEERLDELAHYYTTDTGSEVQNAITHTDKKNIAVTANGEAFVIIGSYLTKLDKINSKLLYLTALNVNGSGTPATYTGGGFYAYEDGSSLYFSIDTSIYKYNVSENTFEKVAESTTEITDIAVDVLGNIFYLSENTLYKVGESTTSIALSADNISFDFTTGTIYSTTNQNCKKTVLYQNETKFVTDYFSLPALVDVTTYSTKNEVVDAISTNENAILYGYRSLETPIHTYSSAKNLIVLDDNDEKFYYVLDSNFENGYKTGYVLKNQSTLLTHNANEVENLTVIVSNVKLFNLPNSVKPSETTYAPSLKKVSYGTILETIASPLYPTDKNGTNFIAVKVIDNEQNFVCYVDSRTVINSADDNALANVLVSNASTRAKTTIYQDSALTQEIDNLEKNFSITLLEIKDDVCKIEYILDGEVKSGYCHKSFVNDGTLSGTQILGIILVGVTLILAICIAVCIAIVKKRKKKQALE
ncbi:MAG: hypothetical protein IJ301_01235 [Clostridia bacterium]|nr:hypothetical protein [Clostridia bacterium]